MFFRSGTEKGKRNSGRSGGSTQAQLKELRAKARRRLVGALALVLAAVIVVPWLFDEPATETHDAPIVIPEAPAGLPADTDAADTNSPWQDISPADGPPPADGAASSSPDEAGHAPADTPESAAAPDQSEKSPASGDHPESAEPAPTDTDETAAPAAKPEPREDNKASKPEKPEADESAAKQSAADKQKSTPETVKRTDDGSVARALLEGKTPSGTQGAASSAAKGHFYLQVAAYSTEKDANQRRDRLHDAGVTDAYVEKGQSDGRTVYRLRVGPFGSHEAAQAAQARLRALGYENGLISGK